MVQLALSAREYVPPPHVSHADDAASDFLPASQIEHWLAPLAENCPAVQSVQFSASASEYVPPSHVSHDAAAASDFLPESQIVHEAAPLLE